MFPRRALVAPALMTAHRPAEPLETSQRLCHCLGTIPLAIATGASANSRHSIGTGVIGGTLVATIVAIFFIPMFYWLLETVSAKLFPSKPDEAAAAGGKPKGEAASGGGAAPVAPHAPGEAD